MILEEVCVLLLYVIMIPEFVAGEQHLGVAAQLCGSFAAESLEQTGAKR